MKLCLLDIYFYFKYVIILVFGVIESPVQSDLILLNIYTNLIYARNVSSSRITSTSDDGLLSWLVLNNVEGVKFEIG